MENIIFANDLGNGYVKGKLNEESIEIPSLFAKALNGSYSNTLVLEELLSNKQAAKNYFKSIYNKMYVSIESDALSQSGDFFVGQRAQDEAVSEVGFDITTFTQKAKSDLSIILTLAIVANKAVKDKFNSDFSIPRRLQANVALFTALPATEKFDLDILEQYRNKYLGHKHTVKLLNFSEPITVEIKFKAAKISREGEIAHAYLLKNKNSDFQELMDSDFHENNNEIYHDISSQELVRTGKVCVLDIGDGTTDLSFIDLNSNSLNIIDSIPVGFGAILNDAMASLRINHQKRVGSRNQLFELISTKPNNIVEQQRQKAYVSEVYKYLDVLASQVTAFASETLSQHNKKPDAIVVLGGGSILLNEHSNLRESLKNAFKDGIDDIPVIFTPKEYAQKMNLLGLILAADFYTSKQETEVI